MILLVGLYGVDFEYNSERNPITEGVFNARPDESQPDAAACRVSGCSEQRDRLRCSQVFGRAFVRGCPATG